MWHPKYSQIPLCVITMYPIGLINCDTDFSPHNSIHCSLSHVRTKSFRSLWAQGSTYLQTLPSVFPYKHVCTCCSSLILLLGYTVTKMYRFCRSCPSSAYFSFHEAFYCSGKDPCCLFIFSLIFNFLLSTFLLLLSSPPPPSFFSVSFPIAWIVWAIKEHAGSREGSEGYMQSIKLMAILRTMCWPSISTCT